MHWRSGGIWLDKPFTAVPRRQAVSSHQPKIHPISHQKSRPCLTKTPPLPPKDGFSSCLDARVGPPPPLKRGLHYFVAIARSRDLAGSSRDELLGFRKRRPRLGQHGRPPHAPCRLAPHSPEPHLPNKPPSQQHHSKHEQSSSCLSSSL